MATIFRLTMHLSGSALAVGLLTACASSPPPQETTAEPAPPIAAEQPLVIPFEPAVQLRPDYPEHYTVVRGDTLWDISARFLNDPWMWPQLWHGNPQVENPHLIYPGDVLTLYFIDGKPAMRVERPYLPEGMRAEDYHTQRLSPRIREESLDAAISTIPLDLIRPFLTRPRVVTDKELKAAPYVVAHDDERLMSGAGYRIYARGLDLDTLTDEYVIVRQGEVYTDPDSRRRLGIEAMHVGDVRLSAYGDPSTLQVVSSNREILRGDRLMPKELDPFEHHFLPRPPPSPVNGRIISVMDGVGMIGQHRVVVINLGTRDEIRPGHVLAVNQAGPVVKDTVKGGSVKLPDDRAGTIMVFRSFERVSYALVMHATKPLALLDPVLNP
jgi:hypothetical protein